MNPSLQHYTQKIGYTRGSLWSPFLTVGMALRLEGDLPPEQLSSAVRKLCVLHPALASRVVLEDDGSAYLTTKGVAPCSLEIRNIPGNSGWKSIFLEQEHIPFAFERGPIGRFFLVRSKQFSDVVVVIPHVIGDGYAMIQLMSDLLILLNDPGKQVEFPDPFPPAVWENIPDAGTRHLLLRGLIKTANLVLPVKGLPIRQGEYERAHREYWQRRSTGLFTIDLTPAQTTSLVENCRRQGVKVTGALAAAFLLAQRKAGTGAWKPIRDITVDVNIRDRVSLPQGTTMGGYSSNIVFTVRETRKLKFWTLARNIQNRIQKGLNDRSRFVLPLALGQLSPHIADRQLLEMTSGRLADRLGKLTGLFKFQGFHPNLDLSNIGQFPLPSNGGIFRPLGMFTLPPLWPGGGLALTVTTINGHMNLTQKFFCDQLDDPSAARMAEIALEYLMEG